MIVVDTNVMAYLVLGVGERARHAAEALERDPDWVAPAILVSELRNVLVGVVRRGHADVGDAMGMLDDAMLVLGERIVSPASPGVVKAALELGLSAYDAEFVVTARELGATLLTADRQVLAAAPDVAVALG